MNTVPTTEGTQLLQCPFCASAPELVDDRLVFYVRCENHLPPFPVIYGDSFRHLDHIENGRLAQAAINAVDWPAARLSAITAWNTWARKVELPNIPACDYQIDMEQH